MRGDERPRPEGEEVDGVDFYSRDGKTYLGSVKVEEWDDHIELAPRRPDMVSDQADRNGAIVLLALLFGIVMLALSLVGGAK